MPLNHLLIEKTRTMPSIVTLTKRSPMSSLWLLAPRIWTPIFGLVCCPNLTILVPALQSQATKALSAPAEIRCLLERAIALIPFRCPCTCCNGLYVTEEKRCTRLSNPVNIVKPKIGNDLPNVMEAHSKDLFFRQEIETADSLVNLNALLFLACLDIPESNSLIVATADETFAWKSVIWSKSEDSITYLWESRLCRSRCVRWGTE